MHRVSDFDPRENGCEYRREYSREDGRKDGREYGREISRDETCVGVLVSMEGGG
jgi:hypothetical protein